MLLLLFSVALVAGGGFAAFYLQQALEEVHQIGAKNEETALEHAKLHGRMESVLEQVGDSHLVLDSGIHSYVMRKTCFCRASDHHVSVTGHRTPCPYSVTGSTYIQKALKMVSLTLNVL